ncbi:pfh1 [Symbiodinium sp. CCMP2592]|nr:pfh1 [Symbiodinium sp. CCMP2592]
MEDESGVRPLPADLGQALRRDVTSFLTAHAFEQGDFAESWLEEAERLDRGSEEAWAGNDSIVAFSLMKRCRVHVHTYLPDGSIVAIDSTHRDLQNLADLPTVHVFYNGQDHYDALVQAEDVALLVPAWKGQTWPMRYWRLPGELPPLESGDALPPIKKTRSAESVLAPEAPDPAEDILDEVCKAIVAPASTHPHRQMEDAITKLATTRLRDHPTLPPLALPEEVDAGEAWPHAFCAFSGCLWTARTGTEDDLLQHLHEQHGPDLDPLANLLWNGHDEHDLLSIYNAALSVKCRSAAPLAGSSLDRIALEKFAEATAEDHVESLICFSCACSYTRIAETEARGDIQWHRPLEQTNKFLGQPVKVIEQLLGLDQFLGKYNHLVENTKLTDSEDFENWHLKLAGEAQHVRLLCCPEDHRCTRNPEHPRARVLCEHCEVPVCRGCLDCLSRKKLPPASLANDMWTGYGPERLYQDNVTVMEMLCASPYITTLVCLTMEARYRAEGAPLDQTAHMPRHRMGARGNAITFPLPWEDLLRKLEGQDTTPSDLPRGPNELSDVVRVILKTNKTGQTSEADLKNLIHQARVRRHVVVQLILDMRRCGHPSFQEIQEEKMREKASSLPEDGVPPEVVKIFGELDDSQEKLQPQKAATPVDGLRSIDQAGKL